LLILGNLGCDSGNNKTKTRKIIFNVSINQNNQKIDSVKAIIFDQGGLKIQEGEPWDYGKQKKIMDKIEARENLKIVVYFMNKLKTVIFQGEETGIKVETSRTVG
jgi:hypothetical protein